MTQIYLAEVTAQVNAAGDSDTLYVASAPSGYNHPDAPDVYLPLLKQPSLLERNIVAQGRTIGESAISYGELVVDNTDGSLDAWFTYGYGAQARVLIGTPETAYGSLTTVIDGIVEQVSGTRTELRFRFRDRQIELENPASPALYDGSNSGATGIEGTPDDLQGSHKIRARGKVLNVLVDHVNTSQQIFALNHDTAGATAAVTSVDAVRNNGAAWTFGSDRADLAALQAASPAQGVFDTCLAEGLIKLGGTIGSGAITCDYTVGTGDDLHPANIAEWLLLDAGVASGDIVSADVTQVSTDAPYDSGIVITDQTYKECLDLVMGGIVGWYAPNRLGDYNLGQIKAPSGTADAVFRLFTYGNKATVNDYAVVNVDKQISNDQGRGVPAWRVELLYAPIWHVQDKDAIAASVSEADKEKYSTEYRRVFSEDASIKDQFPEAVELQILSNIIDEVDAQSLADDLLSTYSVRRDLFRMTANYDVSIAGALDLGDVVDLYYDRFQLTAGKKFYVHGIRYDARKELIEVELWG